MEINLGKNLNRIRDQLRQIQPSLAGLQGLVEESWAYAEQNGLFIESGAGNERLFCLKVPTYGGRALFLRIRLREDGVWECVYMLHRNRFDSHPVEERDPWNDALFAAFPGLRDRLEELSAVQTAGWEPPAAEALGPESLDRDRVTALIEQDYIVYSDRPYLPGVFGFGAETWKAGLVEHILTAYAKLRESGGVYEVNESLFVCDIGLTNANREYLYLFIRLGGADEYSLYPARLVRNVFVGEKDAIYRILNAIRPTQKNYPLLTQWAYVDESFYEKNLYHTLLRETWCFSNEPQSKESEITAIKRYLENTFVRLLWEDKLLVFSRDKYRTQRLGNAEWAVFNTGLVDKTYRPVFAVFQRNDPDKPKPIWKLIGFDVADGGSMVNIPQIPERAQYFQNMRDMFYDFSVSNAKNPAIRMDHILIENFDRLPLNVQKKYLGRDYDRYLEIIHSGKNAEALLENRDRAKNKLIGCFQLALQKALCRAEWNYRTGVPMYYIREGTMTILLPIALEQELQDDWEEEAVISSCDLALVMSCIEEGGESKYTAKTILPLDKAYSNARLVTRPDSDWLIPQEITATQTLDED